MSEPTLPSFRYRLEQRRRALTVAVSRGPHLSGSSLLARASPALLCAYNPVACANSISTRLPPSCVTSCWAIVAPPC